MQTLVARNKSDRRLPATALQVAAARRGLLRRVDGAAADASQEPLALASVGAAICSDGTSSEAVSPPLTDLSTLL